MFKGTVLSEEKCFYCKNKLGKRFVLSNSYQNETPTFIHLPMKESCHAECYIEKCVEVEFEKMIQKHRDKWAGW